MLPRLVRRGKRERRRSYGALMKNLFKRLFGAGKSQRTTVPAPTLPPEEPAEDLFSAARHKDAATLQMLLDKGAHVNTQGRYGWTALMVASEEGHRESVQVLLDNGADVNIASTNCTTALMLAAVNGHSNIVKALLNNGADVNAQDIVGGTALIWRSQKSAARM